MLSKKLLLFTGVLSASTLFAQTNTHKLPAYRTENEQQLMVERAKQAQKLPFGKTGFTFPGKVRYPGEFEESQAVCISWSPDYDNQGKTVGVDTESEWGYISAQLAHYISEELPVWIRVTKPADTTQILTKMQSLGWPLTHNYTFFINQGDDWWMRDYGPNGVYIGDKDSLAIIDIKYYDGRDYDNEFPKVVASHLGISNYESTLNGEGGNLMSDGFGRVFFSDVMDDANKFILGWDSTQTIDTYNRPFRIIVFPMPTGDAGTINLKSCAQINADARTYINGITLNKTYLYPSYSNDVDGNKTQTAEATRLYQKYMPGYKVIPIDARVSSPAGGSIHCITMQIPADNPVLIWHPSIDGYNPINNPLNIQAKITNRSGIASAVCMWKKKTSATWNTLTLTAGANDMWTGKILPGTVTTADSIDYYIEAVTNNGKTAMKPITAPEGFYTIFYKPYATGLEDQVVAKNHVFGAYPNPVADALFIPFQLIEDATVEIRITDITGKESGIKQLGNLNAGFYKHAVLVNDYPNGFYFYTVYLNGASIGTRKFIIKH
jgi:agmatine/peptidylarginine deiminase